MKHIIILQKSEGFVWIDSNPFFIINILIRINDNKNIKMRITKHIITNEISFEKNPQYYELEAIIKNEISFNEEKFNNYYNLLLKNIKLLFDEIEFANCNSWKEKYIDF